MLASVWAGSAFDAKAQLQVTESVTGAQAEALVEDILVGGCVTVSNVTFSGLANGVQGSVGSFSNGATTSIGLDEGILLTTGRPATAIGPNTGAFSGDANGVAGDADLTAIVGTSTYDAAVLEFDFVPLTDTVSFRYVFASDEYSEYVNLGFNDLFGFFISGPGYAGPYLNGAENIALLPASSTFVAIDNVNNGNAGAGPGLGPCTNCQYFVENHGGLTIEYDGFTTVLTAVAEVQPCQSYHMKLVIADALDDVVDSGVFLEAGSFTSGEAVDVVVTAAGPLPEGCTTELFTFTRQNPATIGTDAVVQFDVTGTATSGVDFTAFPSSITIPAGDMSVTLSVDALLDFTAEGDETIIVTVTNTECSCTPSTPPEATAIIQDNDTPLSVNTSGSITICQGQTASLTAIPSGSLGPYQVDWDNGGGPGYFVDVTPASTTTYTVTVTDVCGTQQVTGSETVTVVLADYSVNSAAQCLNGNQFEFTNQGYSGAGVTHDWDFGDSNSSTDENPSHTYAAAGDYTVTHTVTWTASGCQSVFVTDVEVWEHPDPTASVIQDVTCTQQGEVTVNVTGGESPYDYLWNNSATTPTITGLGTGTYTVTVTDDNGCDGQSQATVANVLSGPPTAICQDFTVQLNASGSAIIFATQIDNGSNDPCGIASMTVSPATFDCGDIGANTVTLTVENTEGTTATCTATVTVEDNIAPTAVCQNITVQLDGSGNATITAAQIDNGSDDNCGITTMSVSPNSFTCADIGANTVTLTVEDASGNTSTCAAIVTVQETVPPTAICQNISVQLDASGNVSITAAQIDNGSDDNCGIQSLAVSPNTFTCADIGANTVTLTVTDESGNSATCNAMVTVEDNIAPTAICQDITVQLDGSGNAVITAAQVDNGSDDNCAITAMSVSPSTFTCADIGANTVTLTVEDASGNTSNCTATVTVEDNVAPTATCQNITVQLDASGNASITAAQIDNGSDDNCGIQSLAVSPNTFTCADLVANTVTLTVTDDEGNSSTCDATVTVEDNIAPTAVCQDITVQLDGSGNASITAAQVDNGSDDNCAITAMSVSPSTFTCTDIGSNTVTLTVEDAIGNTSSCTATVTVEGSAGLTAICQDITVQLDAAGNASISTNDIDNGSAADCGGVTLAIDQSNFTCADIGANTVTLTATDGFGNSETCTATVTVEDNIAPTATCQNITVLLDASGNASITAAQIDNGSTDNCAIQSMTVSPNSFTCADIGANTVTLTVTDVNGNTSTCTATVTIEDNIAPTATCQDITVQLDASGNASITAAQIDNGSMDNCGIQSMTVSPNSFTCADLGANTVTLTVTDVNGNTATCDATVTVEDDIAPTAICQNITVQVDATGNASITAAQIDNGSDDNCGIQSMTVSPNSFTCAELGTNTVTLTVTDDSGNSATCNATVTVEDNIAPTALCQDITVQVGGAGSITVNPNQIDNGSDDNCTITVMNVSPSSFSCADIGPNSVTLTVEDAAGNTSSCTATVTVEAVAGLTAICQDITVQLDASGNASITANDIDNGSGADCGAVNLSIDRTDFTCADLGPNTVTLTATDGFGNSETCTATVTVEDNIDPTAICQNITIQLDASGNASITAAQINNGSVDNCAIQSMVVSANAFTCADLGANTVTLTVTDVEGNSSTCTATVTVEDNIAPNAVCQDITVQLDGSGNATITAAQIDNTSSDNCAITTMSVAPSSFTCADGGPNTVTLTVEDASGNSSTCTATVTVEDNITPNAVCQDITVQLDASGNASIIAAQIDNGSDDNCGIQSLAVNPSAFTCADLGANTVTLTVTDDNGNSSTCTATVTLEDNIAPNAICQDITVQLDGSGNASIVAADVDNGSTDNCAITAMGVSPSTFTCADIGPNTVTLTVEDASGNTSTCTSTVTVEGNSGLVANCQNITVQLDASGAATVSANDIDNGSGADCGGVTLTLDQTDFTCADIGANTVTLTATDGFGNSETCTATVTVEDNIDPTAVCQDITVQVGGAGNITVNANQVDNGSDDNCGIVSMTVSPNSFSCANVGPNTVTLTVTDASGNSSTCTATVTVEVNAGLVALCQDITVQLDASGNASITTDDIDNGSGADCGAANLSIDQTDFTCADLGPNTVTLTATDGFGNSETCTATVTVVDAILPTALCQNMTVQLDASGAAIITAAEVDNGSSDNCGIVSFLLDNDSFDCSNLGANAVTLTVSDAAGNSNSCASTVTVQDNIPPTAVCQDITVQVSGPGNVSITAAQVNNGSSDNCGIVSMSVAPNSFNCNSASQNNVTLTVSDAAGNTSSCTAIVTVEVSSGLVAQCQDITVQLDASGNASITVEDIDNGSGAGCGAVNLSIDQTDFTCADLGPNMVTLTATDGFGNTETCTATVTVEDNIDPNAICRNLAVSLNAAGEAIITAAQVNNGSTDNCGITSLLLSNDTFDCSDIGPNSVTLTVSDASGNTSSCSATALVQDNINPTAICQDITVQASGPGSVSISADDVDNGSFDNCAIVSMTVSPNSFTCDDAGPNTVTLTVTDVVGRTSSCTATVTVVVNSGLVAQCQDITVQLNASGNASITVDDIDNGSGAGCGAVNLSIDQNSFTCDDAGPNTVMLTATDEFGNSETCTATVTVEDNIPPTAICQDITLVVGGAGSVSVTADEIDNGSYDNCGIVSMTVSPNGFTCADVGDHSVTLTLTDAAGNTSTCTSTVTVETVDGLVAVCQNITVQLDANGAASIAVDDIDNGSGADCGAVNLSLDRTDFTCDDLGANTVTLTATDDLGNTATCNATVTVEDNIAPIFTFCPSDMSITAEEGFCAAEGMWQMPIVTDNCGVTVTSTHVSGDVFPIGITTVTYTATDGAGNTDTCSFDVEVTGFSVLSAELALNEYACGYHISCNGLNDGNAEVEISGGCEPYTVLWSNGANTPEVTGLAAGNVSVTVTDGSGASLTLDSVLIQPEPLTLSSPELSGYVGGVNVSCKAASDGSISVEVTGGSDCTDYLVTWTGPNGFLSSDLNIDGLMAGTYVLDVRDANGCFVGTTVTLTEPDALNLVISDVTDVSCNGGADGSASVSVSGGTEPYSLTFENGDPFSLLINLEEGLYTLILTDTNGCEASATAIIGEPEPLVVSVLAVADASCFGTQDGEAEIEVVGGTEPYAVNWEGGQSGTLVNGLGVGFNVFTITDANDCVLIDSVEVGSPEQLVIDTIQVTHVLCQGGSDGSATAMVTGGVEPYTFAWPPSGQTDNPVTGLSTGNFTLNVTDANGCTASQAFIVTQPQGIGISLSADTSVCPGQSVILSVSATGGSGNFTYVWDNGLGAGAQHQVFPVESTSYGVTVTDANGCSVVGTEVDVTVFPSPAASFTAHALNPCIIPTEFVTVNTSQGATSYVWFQDTTIFTDLAPVLTYDSVGTYTIALVVTSAPGCTDSATATVTVHPLPVADFVVSNPDGCLPVSTVLTSTSSNAVTFDWDFGDGTDGSGGSVGHSFFIADSYAVTLTVTSAQGCTDQITIDSAVVVYPYPVADFTIVDLGSELGSDYEFQNNSTGGVTFSWQFGDGGSSDLFNPTYSFDSYGGYDITLYVTNQFGCVDTARQSVTVDLLRGLFVPNAMAVGNTGGTGVFRPVGTGIAQYKAMVYDKWGNQLWESTELFEGSPTGEWDGSYRGELVPQGSYIWNVEARFLDGTIWEGMAGEDGKLRSTGTVTVLY